MRNCAVPPDNLRSKITSRTLPRSKSHILYIPHRPYTARKASWVARPHCCALPCALNQTFAQCKVFLEGTLILISRYYSVDRLWAYNSFTETTAVYEIQAVCPSWILNDAEVAQVFTVIEIGILVLLNCWLSNELCQEYCSVERISSCVVYVRSQETYAMSTSLCKADVNHRNISCGISETCSDNSSTEVNVQTASKASLHWELLYYSWKTWKELSK